MKSNKYNNNKKHGLGAIHASIIIYFYLCITFWIQSLLQGSTAVAAAKSLLVDAAAATRMPPPPWALVDGGDRWAPRALTLGEREEAAVVGRGPSSRLSERSREEDLDRGLRDLKASETIKKIWNFPQQKEYLF
jgi:hypothetical protein